MKSKSVTLVLVFMVLFSLLYISIPSTKSEIPQNGYEPSGGSNPVIWIASDVHVVGPGYGGHTTPAAWSDVIGDVIGLNVDYAFFLGDDIDWSEEHGYTFDQQWGYFWNNSGETYGWHDVVGNVTYENIVIGNHDGGWGVTGDAAGRTLNWTYTIGNIIFIAFGDYFPYENSYSTRGTSAGWYMPALDWVNQTIQDNVDKNVILLCHYPLYNTTYCTGIDICGPNYAMKNDNDTEYKAMLAWLNNSGYHVDAWIHAHIHNTATQSNMVYKFDTLHIDDMAISVSGKGTHDSTFWYFEDGSKTVTIRGYKHDDNSWYSTAYFPYNFNLTYSFDWNYTGSSTPQFISINGGTNGTTLYNSTPVFIWTKISNTSQYHLQVATDSAFTSLVVNLSDINELNYPTEYDDTTNVSFTLPTVNKLPAYDTYYCRVRAYTS